MKVALLATIVIIASLNLPGESRHRHGRHHRRHHHHKHLVGRDAAEWQATVDELKTHLTVEQLEQHLHESKEAFLATALKTLGDLEGHLAQQEAEIAEGKEKLETCTQSLQEEVASGNECRNDLESTVGQLKSSQGEVAECQNNLESTVAELESAQGACGDEGGEPECEWMDNTYYFYGDYTTVQGVGSLEECCKICKDDDECTNFSWGKLNIGGYSGKCELKRGGNAGKGRSEFKSSPVPEIFATCGCSAVGADDGNADEGEDSSDGGEKFRLVNGCSKDDLRDDFAALDASDLGFYDPNEQLAEVNCCSHDGSTCTRKHPNGECLSGAGIDDTKYNWFEAQKLCEKYGLTLCSTQEEVDQCCGTGCYYNHAVSWTSESATSSDEGAASDQPYTSLGCWKDENDRAIEGGFVRLGSRGGDPDPVTACYERAKSLGNKFFAVQHETACFANSNTAGDTYKRYGEASNCAEDGTGGGWANSVYQIA